MQKSSISVLLFQVRTTLSTVVSGNLVAQGKMKHGLIEGRQTAIKRTSSFTVPLSLFVEFTQ